MFRARILLLSLSLVAALPLTASAQNGTPHGEGDRYLFNRVEDGFVRLDRQTGQVSLCSRRSLGWACHPLPDERIALEDEIARLQKQNAALKQELVSRGILPPGTKQGEAPAPTRPEPGVTLPPDPDLDRAMAYAEKLWKRLVEMIARLRRDIFTQL